MNLIIPALGLWFWWIVAAILLFGELMMPGVFLLWLGVAAAFTGIVAAVVTLGWQGEIMAFAALSLVMVVLSWKWVTAQWRPKSDQPHLNQRHLTYVGRSVMLDTAIVGGRGKVTIDATIWDVEGADAAAGTKVTVTGVNGMRLVVG
jgi:inner membrane protein